MTNILFGQSSGCAMVSHCGLNLHLSNDIFSCFYLPSMYFFYVKYMFKYFVSFSIGVLVFLSWSFKHLLYILDTILLSHIHLANVFFQLRLTVFLGISVFWRIKMYNFYKSQIKNLSPMVSNSYAVCLFLVPYCND